MVDHTETRSRVERLSEISHWRAWWLIMSAIALAIVLGLGAIELIRLLALPLAILVFGLTLAAALAPLVSWLGRWVPRLVAMLLVYLFLVLLLVGLVWAVIPSLVNQITGFTSALPDLIDQAGELVDGWRGNLPEDSFTSTIISQLSSIGSTLLKLPLMLTSAISGVLLIVFISFYILIEAENIREFFLSLFPEERRPHISHVLSEMGQAMGGYVRGSLINGLIVGAITFVGLQLLGIDFALTFGALAGVMELIPVVGPIVAGLIIVVFTLLQSPGQALFALIFLLVMQQVENNILVPNIMRNQTDVSPLLTILAIFAGAAIGGLLGALIAIPIAAALRVLVRQVLAPAIRSKTRAEAVEEDSG